MSPVKGQSHGRQLGLHSGIGPAQGPERPTSGLYIGVRQVSSRVHERLYGVSVARTSALCNLFTYTDACSLVTKPDFLAPIMERGRLVGPSQPKIMKAGLHPLCCSMARSLNGMICSSSARGEGAARVAAYISWLERQVRVEGGR